MTIGYRVKRGDDGQPLVDQHNINGWNISYNPDDGRYHVAVAQRYAGSAITFAEMRNAVQWAKTHEITAERRQQAGLD